MVKIAEKKKLSLSQNRYQAFLRKLVFFTLQKGKPKDACALKGRKFYAATKKSLMKVFITSQLICITYLTYLTYHTLHVYNNIPLFECSIVGN